jgi:uncharacterized membrane protein YraQ (UPF0718 family)
MQLHFRFRKSSVTLRATVPIWPQAPMINILVLIVICFENKYNVFVSKLVLIESLKNS